MTERSNTADPMHGRVLALAGLAVVVSAVEIDAHGVCALRVIARIGTRAAVHVVGALCCGTLVERVIPRATVHQVVAGVVGELVIGSVVDEGRDHQVVARPGDHVLGVEEDAVVLVVAREAVSVEIRTVGRETDEPECPPIAKRGASRD